MQQNNKNLKILGKRIQELRLEKSKSLNKFIFQQGGISTATLSRIENGIVNIKFNTLIKISAILGISISDLLKDLNFDYKIEE